MQYESKIWKESENAVSISKKLNKDWAEQRNSHKESQNNN